MFDIDSLARTLFGPDPVGEAMQEAINKSVPTVLEVTLNGFETDKAYSVRDLRRLQATGGAMELTSPVTNNTYMVVVVPRATVTSESVDAAVVGINGNIIAPAMYKFCLVAMPHPCGQMAIKVVAGWRELS